MEENNLIRDLKAASLGVPIGDCQYPGVINEWCLTKTNTTKHSFTWTIEDFSNRPEELGEPIESLIFPADAKAKTKWKLFMYPRGYLEGCEDYISIFLSMIQKEENKRIRASLVTSLLNNKYETERASGYRGSFQDYSVNTKRGFDKFMRRADLFTDELLPGDKLTIHCDVEVFSGSSQSFIPAKAQVPSSICTLSTDLWDSFEKQKLSDIVIQVGSREFKAHKTILAARSAMFSGMFSHDMQESRSNRVELSDIEPDVFQEVLRYIYTGRPLFASTTKEEQGINQVYSGQHSFAIELLKAATKYQLDVLKLLCEYRLCNLLSINSVVEILSVADQHQAVWLKDRAISFAINHANELTEKGCWELLSEINPKVLAQVIARQSPAKRYEKED